MILHTQLQTRQAGCEKLRIKWRQHPRQATLALDVKVILTPPCIFH
jgi:hypothetical protein